MYDFTLRVLVFFARILVFARVLPKQNAWNPAVSNADNGLLGATNGNGFSIGTIDEVNGSGAAEVPEFNVTRHELIQIAKYWAEATLDSEYWCFLFQQIGSAEIRLQPYAWRRVSRIADLLGNEVVEKAIQEVKEEMGKTRDAEAWRVFLSGSNVERAALQSRIASEMTEAEPRHGSEVE